MAGYQSLLAGQVGEAQLRLGRALDATATGSAPARAPADLRARIATQLAIIGLVSLSYPEMIEYGQIAVAENSADPRVSAFAWFARTVGLALAGRGSQALADLDARGTGPGLEPLIAQGMVKLWTDDLDGAIQHLKEATERAYRGEALRVGQALAFLGDAEYRRGLLAESVLHTELAVGDAEENERYWDYALLHGLACQTQAALGDWARAEEHSSAAVLWAPLVGTRAGLLSAAGTRAVIAQARGDAVALLKAAEDFETVFDPLEPGITLLGPRKRKLSPSSAAFQMRRPRWRNSPNASARWAGSHGYGNSPGARTDRGGRARALRRSRPLQPGPRHGMVARAAAGGRR